MFPHHVRKGGTSVLLCLRSSRMSCNFGVTSPNLEIILSILKQTFFYEGSSLIVCKSKTTLPGETKHTTFERPNIFLFA